MLRAALLSALLAVALVGQAQALNDPGVLSLDKYSFDKARLP